MLELMTQIIFDYLVYVRNHQDQCQELGVVLAVYLASVGIKLMNITMMKHVNGH